MVKRCLALISSVTLTRGSIGSTLTEGLSRGIENHIERDTDAIAAERIPT